MLKKFLFLIFALVLIAAGVLYFHAVDNSLTQVDKQYIIKIMGKLDPLGSKAGFGDQLRRIAAVQRAVLKLAPVKKGIPYGRTREPKDLYEAKAGLCYDRSRTIEKILRFYGFKTRHVSIYAKRGLRSTLAILLTPRMASHAVSSVLTRRGWIVVDSNYPWIALDKKRNPISMAQMYKSQRDGKPIDWATPPPAKIYKEPFVYLFGLYSRHGKFYPPFNAIPDVHYGELMQNFF